ncbi:MAG: class I SAM-dependent methyltransferase [Acidobacteriota bacterium]
MAEEAEGASMRRCATCLGPRVHRRLFEKSGFPIVACAECGHGSTVVPPDFDPGSIYTGSYFEGGQADGYFEYAASEPVLRGEFRRALRHLQRWAPQEGRLLELGCAYGFFLSEATRAGYDCVGIELSEDAARRGREAGLDIRSDPHLPSALEGEEPFDAAVLLDTIEHVEDPANTVGQIRDALAPGGALLVTTGDFASWPSRLFGSRWRLMTPPQHLSFFTRASLIQLIENAGFEVLSADRGWKLVPLGLILFQLRRTGLPVPRLPAASRLGLPIPLFDIARIVARRKP